MKKENNLLNSKEVAWILDCSPDDVHELVRRGKLQGTKVGRFWRFHRRDVETYKRKQKEKQIATPLSPFG